MYDYYLGGKDNFPTDREAAELALSVVPFGREVAYANRRFLARAVTFMARDGISQFIDLTIFNSGGYWVWPAGAW
jgi:hypothetical protein